MLAALAPVGALASPLAPASAPPSRCQTSDANASCAFSCHVGDIIGASGIGAGANATCGGASAACSDPVDCLDGGRAASSNGTGTCNKTTASGEYADCFALPAPRARSCGSDVAYDACSFACASGDELVARASTTSASGGWPRVLSLCGGARADCQAWSSCEANATTLAGGNGICLSRTVDTNVTCEARASNATSAPQNDAGSGGDAPSRGGEPVPLATGSYSGELRPAEGDHEDAYVAMTKDHGAWTCPVGEYRVHVEGAGVQVVVGYSIILDTPADFRSDWCVGWALQPTDANATASLAYSMTITTPPAALRPDFVVSDLRVNETVALGAVVPVSFVVTNAGEVAANGSADLYVRGLVASDTLAHVFLTLAPGESTTVTASWSTTGDVGRVSVVASALVNGSRDLNWSNDQQRKDVVIGPVDAPGVVAGPYVRAVRPVTNASPERPFESVLRGVDGVCANPTVQLVDNFAGIAPHFCTNDYNASNGGLWLPTGVALCRTDQGSVVYRTLAERIHDKPPCSPSLRDVAWSEAAILDPIVGSIVDDTGL